MNFVPWEESVQYWCIYAMWTFQYSGGRHTFIIEHVRDNSHFSTLWIVSKTEKGTCLLDPIPYFKGNIIPIMMKVLGKSSEERVGLSL